VRRKTLANEPLFWIVAALFTLLLVKLACAIVDAIFSGLE
jgi:hypothetical protein